MPKKLVFPAALVMLVGVLVVWQAAATQAKDCPPGIIGLGATRGGFSLNSYPCGIKGPGGDTIMGIGGTGTTNYVAKFSDPNNLTTSLIYDNGTNVGIGTASPSQKLSVEGGHFYITNSASDTGLFVVNTSTDGRRYVISSTGNASSAGGGKLNFQDETIGASRMVIDSTGKVGIGTTLPSQKLSVVGTIESTSGGFKFPDGTIQTTASAGGGSSYWAANGNDIYATSTGNVGIGTASPGAKLDVSLTAAGQMGARILMPTGAENTQAGLRIQGYSPAIELMDKDNMQNWYMGIDDNDANKLLIGRGYGPGQGVAQAVTIVASDNNVGIGNTAPTQKLDVAGNLRVRSLASCNTIDTDASGNLACGTDETSSGIGGSGTSNYLAKFSGATTISNSLVYDNGTNVGIGTTSPVRKLDVNGDGVSVGFTSPLGQTRLIMGNRNSAAIPGILASENGNLRLGRGTDFSAVDGGTLTEAMIVNSDGNVGVGTTIPQSRLQVANGYIQVPFTGGGPAGTDCDNNTEGGRMTVSSNGSQSFLWVCAGALGWHGFQMN